MIPLPESARDLIASGPLAHITTLNRDGSAHVTLAWVGIDGEEIVCGTLFDQKKLKNLRRDPRIVVSIEGTDLAGPGLQEYLVIEGRARVVEGGAPELLQELAYVYMGPDVKFPPMDEPPPGFTTRIAAERIKGMGPWTQGK